MLGCAITWASTLVLLWLQEREDREDHATQIAAHIAQLSLQSEGLQRALAEHPADRITAFTAYQAGLQQTMNESLRRMKRRHRLLQVRDYAALGLMGVGLCWTLVTQAQLHQRRRRAEAPERPAEPGAGQLIGELIRRRQSFVARSPAEEVEIDGARSVVVFRRTRFIAAFVGNPVRDCVELPTSDLLSVWSIAHKGRHSIIVRTTAGTVTLHENLHPFQTLAELLSDIVELNRMSPATYRSALAREPVISTSWYGWLLLVAGIGGIATFGWWLLQLS